MRDLGLIPRMPRLMPLLLFLLAVWQATKSAAQERGGANIICPGGYFCPEDVNNPSSYGPPQPCAAGYFCVSGSSAPTTCDFDDLLLKQPDEFLIPTASGQLITPRQSVFIMGQSLLGNYCPELSTSPTTNCADGQYCPNSTVTIICPSGFFCKEGAAEPVDCGSFDPCDEGSDQPGVTFSAIIGIAFGMFVVWALYAGAFFFYKKTARKSQGKVAEQENLYKAIGPLLGPEYDPRQMKLKLFHGIEPVLSIKFHMLGLKLKGTQTVLLKGVCGEFEHSHLYAVMGPSGAGKSTFTNALLGSAGVYGDLTGDVFVNGKATSLLKFKDVVGLVPQDDIVHDDLTVRENLLYSARLRLPNDYTLQDSTGVAEAIVDLLAMRHVSNSLVGTVERRGISGGQRKRVNIGMELVLRPSVCFMDEPTSGLDASATVDVLTALKNLASKGMNIITVIHQPRFSVFNLYDSVLLLGKGGFTAYFGPGDQVQGYMESIGFQMDAGENPADFVLDVVSGSLPRDGFPAFKPTDMDELWLDKGGTYLTRPEEQRAISAMPQRCVSQTNVTPGQLLDIQRYFEASHQTSGLTVYEVKSFLEYMAGAELDIDVAAAFMLAVDPSFKAAENMLTAENTISPVEITEYITSGRYHAALPQKPGTAQKEGKSVDHGSIKISMVQGCCHAGGDNRHGTSLWMVYRLLVVRMLVKKIRAWGSIITNIMLILLTALIVGAAGGSGYSSANWAVTLLFFHLVFTLMFAVTAMHVFGEDKLIYIRETKAGLSTTTLFLAQNTVHLIDIFLLPLCYTALWYGFVDPRISFGWTFLTMIMVAWYTSGVSYWCSIVASLQNGTILAISLLLIMNGFVNGVNQPSTPSTGDTLTYRYLGNFMRFFVGLSSSRWGVEIMMRQEYVEYSDYDAPMTHELMARIGLCGLSSYSNQYDLTTYPANINETLAVTTADELLIDNYCGGYLAWDFLALLLLGFVWRLFSWWAFYLAMRPELTSPVGYVLKGVSWFFSKIFGLFKCGKKD